MPAGFCLLTFILIAVVGIASLVVGAGVYLFGEKGERRLARAILATGVVFSVIVCIFGISILLISLIEP